AQIRAVMFRPQIRHLGFTPEDGMKVIVRGRISVYEPRGEYQILLDYMEPLGLGAMALAFDQLKRKLSAQGLFDEKIKRPLPFLPRHIAVITSPTGAAIRDFLKIIHRRFTNVRITVIPVKVQGEDAAPEMIDALKIANRELDADIIVLTRGGGSLEDLWAFNNEGLALAIRASDIPVVSAVGHEIDITISDLAADFRAPTPSAAAEMIVAEKEGLYKELDSIRDRIKSFFDAKLRNLNQAVIMLKKGLRDPRRRLADSWLHLDDLNNRIVRAAGRAISDKRSKLDSEERSLLSHSPGKTIYSLGQTLIFNRHMLQHVILRVLHEKSMGLDLLAEKIKTLSPYSILERGYSIALKLPEKRALSSVEGLEIGDAVRIMLNKGELDCRIEKIKIKGD
ncbi:MAG: exodeoxyribonuclease VII large subunit, partial [Deltaproteobacteria bacterium]|nr:exodeoxyribonuclease VII large subunit [Deltaproteobacteria bacterium]